METVNEQLATPYGLTLCAPPVIKTSIDVMRAVVFNPGVKENAGIFNHTQGWGVLAECLLGHGARPYEIYRVSMPAAYNERAELRRMGPYMQGQTSYSTHSPRAGNARTPWLTGAAAWAYFSATQYILGLRPEIDGLRIDPCVPSTWEGFTATRRFRGKTIQIEVSSPCRVCRGVKGAALNSEPPPTISSRRTRSRSTTGSRSCWDRCTSASHDHGGPVRPDRPSHSPTRDAACPLLPTHHALFSHHSSLGH